MIGNCEICDKEIDIYILEPGDCGAGQPSEPPVCSEECYMVWKRKINDFLLELKRKERKDKLEAIK